MRITKYGHCCLLIEIAGKRILTDPGSFSSGYAKLTDIDLILITHEHADHLHTESLTELIKHNPKVKIITNSAVGKILKELGIKHDVLEGNDSQNANGVAIEAFEGQHAEIYEDFGQVQNTGYFIGEELFYPGDAYTEPGKAVPALALPVAGPWCKAADAIAYAKRVRPKKAFPVHDAVLSENGLTVTHHLFAKLLAADGIDFLKLRQSESIEL